MCFRKLENIILTNIKTIGIGMSCKINSDTIWVCERFNENHCNKWGGIISFSFQATFSNKVLFKIPVETCYHWFSAVGTKILLETFNRFTKYFKLDSTKRSQQSYCGQGTWKTWDKRNWTAAIAHNKGCKILHLLLAMFV